MKCGSRINQVNNWSCSYVMTWWWSIEGQMGLSKMHGSRGRVIKYKNRFGTEILLSEKKSQYLIKNKYLTIFFKRIIWYNDRHTTSARFERNTTSKTSCNRTVKVLCIKNESFHLFKQISYFINYVFNNMTVQYIFIWRVSTKIYLHGPYSSRVNLLKKIWQLRVSSIHLIM